MKIAFYVEVDSVDVLLHSLLKMLINFFKDWQIICIFLLVPKIYLRIFFCRSLFVRSLLYFAYKMIIKSTTYFLLTDSHSHKQDSKNIKQCYIHSGQQTNFVYNNHVVFNRVSPTLLGQHFNLMSVYVSVRTFFY